MVSIIHECFYKLIMERNQRTDKKIFKVIKRADYIVRERERERERQTDRQTDRDIERDMKRDREREITYKCTNLRCLSLPASRLCHTLYFQYFMKPVRN